MWDPVALPTFDVELDSENLFVRCSLDTWVKGVEAMMSERKGSAKVGGRRCLARRSGLTILEFVACGVAVAGGAWLGALYLGVNMQHVAFAALSQTRLLDKVPEEYRPADPNAKAMTHEQLATALHEELGSLRTQISSLNGVPTQTADKATEKESGPSTGLAPTKEKTLAYWQKLREIASTNSQLQREAESAFTVDNAAKVFAVKGRVCRFSAKAVEAIPSQGADESVVNFGRQLGSWYDRAGELDEKAVRIWETPMGQQARAQSNEEWKRSDGQQLSEGRLLGEKAATVRSSMSRIYGTEFPAFDVAEKPIAGSESTGKSG